MARPSEGGFHQVKATLSDGTKATYWYAWRGGPRLPGKPGSKEFKDAYRKAVLGKASEEPPPAPLKPQTIETVADAYLDSQDYLKRKPRTQRDYRKHVKKIVAAFGTMPVDVFVYESVPQLRGRFLDWRDTLAKRSLRQSDYTWAVLSTVLSWAVQRGKIKVNPCLGGKVKKLYDGTRADKIWSDEWIAAFYDVASDEMALAMALALWTGQRQGDLLRLTWKAYDGNFIRLKQSKGGVEVSPPVGWPLKNALANALEKRKSAATPSPLIIVNQDGRPYSENGFRVVWGKTCKQAKVPNSRHDGVTFHDLRGTAVTRLFLVGCHEGQIATFTGHTRGKVRSILDKNYFCRDIRLAQEAMAKYEASPFAELEAKRFGQNKG
jgi:integrase